MPNLFNIFILFVVDIRLEDISKFADIFKMKPSHGNRRFRRNRPRRNSDDGSRQDRGNPSHHRNERRKIVKDNGWRLLRKTPRDATWGPDKKLASKTIFDFANRRWRWNQIVRVRVSVGTIQLTFPTYLPLSLGYKCYWKGPCSIESAPLQLTTCLAWHVFLK